MMTAPVGQEFIFHDHAKASTLEQLEEKIKELAQEEFRVFVSESKNDFAAWAKHALGENLLAERLQSTTSKEITLIKIAERLEEKKAEENLFAIAQNHAQEKSGAAEKGAAQDSEKESEKKFTLQNILRNKLMLKELAVGILFGLFLGLFLAALIARWLR